MGERLMVALGTLLIRRLASALLGASAIAVCVLALSACGSSKKPAKSASASATSTVQTTTTVVNGTTTTLTTTTPTRNDVTIYSSLPDSGRDAARSHQIETGVELALKQAKYKAGTFDVSYMRLCDTARPRPKSSAHTPASRSKPTADTKISKRCTGDWSQTRTADNAEQAARDAHAVAYIGELNSGATAVSLPILNQAGIVQITPGSGYIGLTNSVTVKSPKGLEITLPGEPGKYYPEGTGQEGQDTLLRLIPNDLVQASAELYVLHRSGCEKFSAWNFGSDQESRSLLNAVIATALKYKMTDDESPLPKQVKDYEQYAQALAHAGVRCAIMIGHVTNDAVQLTNFLGNQLPPTATIIGSTGFCDPSWTHGLSKNVVARLYCTTAAMPVSKYPGSAGFAKAFRQAYRHSPTAYNLYGYVATEMVLEALRELDTDQDARRAVLTDMTSDSAPDAYGIVRGHISGFSFDDYGNLGDDHYAVESLKTGLPQYYETVVARYLLPSAG